MALVKQPPRATRRISHFAKLFGLSAKTIKRIAKREGWKEIKYSPGPTAPTYLLEKPVLEFFTRRQEER